MNGIASARQRYRDQRNEVKRLLEQQQAFVTTNWLSRSEWRRKGYEIKDGATSIERHFRTPHGIQSFRAFHAVEVLIRSRIWRGMLQRAGEGLDVKPTLNNRRQVHRRLIDLGETGLANRLKPSLVSALRYECDVTHFEWLESKIAAESAEVETYGDAYRILMAPLLERREVSCAKRYLRQRLAQMGVTLPGSDLSVGQLEEHVQAAERSLDLHRLRRALCALGLDGESLPTDVDMRRLWAWLRHGGYLCTVPTNASVGMQVNELRGRGRVTEAWLIVNMSSRIEIQPCVHTDQRMKVVFRQLNTKKYQKLRDFYDDWAAIKSDDAIVATQVAADSCGCN